MSIIYGKLLISNLASGYYLNEASPDVFFTIGNDKNNKFYLGLVNLHQGSNVKYGVLGLNNTENSLKFSLGNYKAKPLPIRISINKQRLRVWLDEIKIVDLQEVVGKKMMQSGGFDIFCTKPWGDRESYPFISNIRIADAGLTERDLSVGAAEPSKTTTTKQTQTKPQSTPTTPPKTGSLSLKDFGTYHALLIAVEDYADPSVNKLDNPGEGCYAIAKNTDDFVSFRPEKCNGTQKSYQKRCFHSTLAPAYCCERNG